MGEYSDFVGLLDFYILEATVLGVVVYGPVEFFEVGDVVGLLFDH